MAPPHRKPLTREEKIRRFYRFYGELPLDDSFLSDSEDDYGSDIDSMFGDHAYQQVAEEQSDSDAEIDHGDAALMDPDFADQGSDTESEPMEDSATDLEEDITGIEPALPTAAADAPDDEVQEVIVIDDPEVIIISDDEEETGADTHLPEERQEPTPFVHRFTRSGKEY